MTTFRFCARGVLIAAALAGASLAGAQSAPQLTPEQYRALTAAVDAAVSARASDPTRSLSELDRARDLFNAAVPEGGSSPLVGGIRDALQNARIAVGRSQTDLEAQAAQARGLLRKALHDDALEALGRADARALGEVALLADDFGLRGAGRRAVLDAAQAGQVDLVRAQLERAAVSKMTAALRGVQTPLNPAARANAYLSTARATSWFSIVQDSPRAGDLTTGAFVTALGQLTNGNLDAFSSSLRALQQGAARFETAAADAVRAAQNGSPARPTTAPPKTTPTPHNVRVNDAPQSGTASAPQGVDALYAPLGRALVASGHGNNARARRALAEALGVLGGLKARNTPEVQALRGEIERVRDLGALRPADVRGVLGSLSNAEDALAGAGASAAESANAAVNRVFGGPLRAVVFTLLALLSLYPLYLLNLAFGGRNPYWRAIGVALALLLLPVMLEGVASLGTLLEGATNVSAFAALANLGVLQQPVGALVWAVLAAGGIALATWGFRGICVQFGLLGRRPKEAAAPQAAVEWDEEL